MPPPRHVFAFAFVCLFLAASVRPSAAQPPSLTGIEVAPGGGVTVRGAGTAGARYDLYRKKGDRPECLEPGRPRRSPRQNPTAGVRETA